MTELDRSTKKVVYDTICRLNPYKNNSYNTRDDMHISKLFADSMQDRICYNVTAKGWYYYDGKRWKLDQGNMKTEALAKVFAECLTQYADGILKEAVSKKTDGEEIDRIRKFVLYAKSFGNLKPRRDMITDARSNMTVEQTDFDRQDNLFNCQNCVIDLDTGCVLEHSSKLMLSKMANVDYDPNVRSKDFEDFMSQIMCGDQEKIAYLRAILGYAMSGTNEREEAYMLYGQTTRNGKSTLLETISQLFGDYGISIKPETLAEQRRNGSTASGDVARLKGSRFVQMSEPPKNMKIDVALFKSLTGRDVITARFLYQSEFDFTPVFKLFINTNYLPVVLDNTLFLSGRMKVITFDRHFTEKEQDKGLKARLRTPENLSGILNWLLEGNRRYRTDRLALEPPVSVLQATERYQYESNKLQRFIDDNLIKDPIGKMSAKEFYPAYTEWCSNEKYSIDNKQDVFSALREQGYMASSGTVDGRTVRNVVVGYRWKD